MITFKRKFEIGPFGGFFGAGPEERNGWSICLSIAMVPDPIRVLVVGWGWDDDLPIRPWPGWSRTYEAHDQGFDSRYDCFGMLGIFMGFGLKLQP